MSRQVLPPSTVQAATPDGNVGERGNTSPTPATPAQAGDEYFDRLIKLIPSESIAAFLAVQGILLSALKSPDQADQLLIWLLIVFIAIGIGNILYMRDRGVTSNIQLAILTGAYILWVLSIGGPFRLLGVEPFIGPVLTILFMYFVTRYYKGQDAQ